jgi:hypothetical protein
MSEVAYRSRVHVVRKQGPDRVAAMPAGEDVPFGVHSEIAAHYGVEMEGRSPTSTTLDYIVAATAG